MDFIKTLYRLKIIPLLKKWNLLFFILGLTDILAILVAFQFSYFTVGGGESHFFFREREMLTLVFVFLPLWILVLYIINITEIPRTKRYRVLIFEYAQSAIVIFVLQVCLQIIFKFSGLTYIFIALFSVIGFMFLTTTRMIEYKVIKIYRSKGYNYLNVILIANESSIPFIDSLIKYPEWGYRIHKIFSDSSQLKERYGKVIKVLPEKTLLDLQNIMEFDVVDEVMFVKKLTNQEEVRKIIKSCEELGVVFRLIQKDSKHIITNAITSTIANTRFLTFINIPDNVFALSIKRLLDVYLSLVLIIICLPLFSIVALLVKLTSKGPVIYKQTRVGLRGRQFNLYKIRTMINNADQLQAETEALNEVDGPAFKILDDPRITMIGKFLRRTGLDELPQLVNILKGEMSLIGPRPPLPAEILKYKRWQLRRLSVRPGLSCFWQIRDNRNRIKFEKWMELDLAYIDNWSPQLDLIILFRTFKTLFKRAG